MDGQCLCDLLFLARHCTHLLQGTMLEKFLTLPEEEFNRYLLDAPDPTEEEVDRRREAFRFSKVIKSN